ncbi:MAG: hypothetical protein V5A62_01130 [Haloarculaceae archaeon]
MRRRQLLRLGAAALPVALAGCTSTGGPGYATTDSPTPADTPVEVVSTADAPDVPVEYDVTMAEPVATGEHPARLHATIRNPTDSAVVLGEERAVQFHHVTSEDGALHLLPADSRVEEFADPGCWRLTDHVAVAEYYGTFEIPAGGSVDAESAVMGGADLPEGTCLPTGEHRVLTSGRVAGDAETLLDGGGEAADYEWGFTLRVG